MPLRRAPPLRVPVVASLPKATPPDELLRTVMQHVLFMHQQIPCVYAELHDFLPGRAGLMRRKATKLLSVMEPLLAELQAAFDAIGMHGDRAVAALVLGPSVAAPRLAYLLRVDAYTDAPASRDGARRLLRAIVAHGSEITSVNPGLCRLHLLLAAPREAHLPDGHFRARPGLKLKLQRAHVCTVVVSNGGGAATPSGSEDASADGSSATPPWLRGLVQGFVPPEPPSRKRKRPMSAEAASPLIEQADELARAPPTPQADAPTPAALSAEEEEEPWIWWQSAALIKGFRLPGGGGGHGGE